MHIFAAAGASYDDLAATDMIGWCHDPHVLTGPTIFPQTYTGGGVLTTMRSCPLGSAVCGVRTKLEESQGGGVFGGDDTALNGIQFSCCTFSLPN